MTKLADPHAVAPYPAFEVVLPQGLVPTLVQLGLQYPDDDRDAAAAASEGLAGLLDSEHPPVSVERAAHVDPEGFRTDIVLAYWAHPAHHLAWRRTRVVCDWFASLCTGPVGGWREAVAALVATWRRRGRPPTSDGASAAGVARPPASPSTPSTVPCATASTRPRTEASPRRSDR